MRRLPKIDKKSADPELLKQYEDMRNERRRQGLYIGLPIILGLCVLSIIALAILQPGITTIVVVTLVSLVLIIGLFLWIAYWSPHGTRLTAFLVVIGSLALCAAGAWFVGWLESQIF